MQINLNLKPITDPLKRAWNENPIALIAAAGLAAASTAKIVDATSAAQGRRAYAKQVKLAEKRQKKSQ